MRRLWLGVVGALAACLAVGVFAGTASALVLAKNGQWCGFAVDPGSGFSAPTLPPAEWGAYTQNGYSTDCFNAESNWFGTDLSPYDPVDVTFEIRQHKFLNNMVVADDENWIRSAHIGKSRNFTASDDGHNVQGTFHRSWEADGTITLDGDSSYFYAVWVGP